NFLIKRFVKDYENVQDEIVRSRYGNLGSIVGILVNLLLFSSKFLIGTIFNSISIVGDAINNLSDAGSCIVTIISFKLSSRPDDHEHPFGHARIEYIASLAVALTVIILGFELIKNSITKILNPTEISFNFIMVIVLSLSVLAKLWLYYFNKNLGNKISSTMMLAAAADSLSDVLATSAVIVSTVLSPVLKFSLDGWMGAIVSILIFKAGFEIIKDALDKLLGGSPSAKVVSLIHNFVCSYDGIYGIHDLVVHDYGPTKTFASLHAEVDARVDALVSHDIIDNIEQDILHKHKIHLVIHMDPIVTDDPETNQVRKDISQLATDIYKGLTVHDLRMVKGETHCNIIFDVVVPYDCKESFPNLRTEFIKDIKLMNSSYNPVIVFERDLSC
ncbi:MAG: cation diffusion facilitator family transporter, partial [Oscillospiraceae bacterium]